MTAGFFAQLQQMAAMSRQATITTAGIVGDDLAINSKQLIGAPKSRKLPMVLAVAKGSLWNKALLIPTALALSATFPAAIMPALTIGGAWLCYDGIEKYLDKKKRDGEEHQAAAPQDAAAAERRQVKKAVRTDMALSAEITAVALWTAAAAPFLIKAAAMVASGLAMTAGVYGVVGGIIRLDDMGAWLQKKKGDGVFSKACRWAGRRVSAGAPAVIKTVGVIGTVAMFLVGGGMVLNGIPGGSHLLAAGLHAVTANPLLQTLLTGAAETLAGVATGFAALPVMKLIEPPLEKAAALSGRLLKKLRREKPKAGGVKTPTPVPAPQPAVALASGADSAPSLSVNSKFNNAAGSEIKNAAGSAAANENQSRAAPVAVVKPPEPK